MSTEAISIKEELVNCLTQQLSEIDLLQAMYPNQGDIVLSENNITEISNFINSKCEYVPNNLDFIINLSINKLKLEIFITLPLSYPIEEPDIYIRCNQLNRQQETSLNSGLSEYIKTNHIGEVCLYTAINWLQDNIKAFSSNIDVATVKSSDTNKIQSEPAFCRIWIYSHHIYNKRKREDIHKLTKEFNLSGFCLPGKPGVICLEGEDVACKECWKVIRSMCWKKIMIKQTECFDSLLDRKFKNFEELQFKNPTNSKHANMSEFSKYMNEHGFNQIFNDFFGLCNE